MIMKLFGSTTLFSLILIPFFSVNSYANQECFSNNAPNLPTSRFILMDDEAYDQVTRLTWKRCAVGQKWDGKTCIGEEKGVFMEDVLPYIKKINEDGDNWRLPTVKEFMSTRDFRCQNPATNATVFPGLKSAYTYYWTSTPAAGKNKVFGYKMYTGEQSPFYMERLAVRFVKER